jgi:hypothetical protein
LRYAIGSRMMKDAGRIRRRDVCDVDHLCGG